VTDVPLELLSYGFAVVVVDVVSRTDEARECRDENGVKFRSVALAVLLVENGVKL
jgi:hypothetical protein